MLGYDPELPAGFQDADLEQAAFEAESDRYWRRVKRAKRLQAEGHQSEAAEACPHGAVQGLKGSGAIGDPRHGEDGYRCRDCGHVVSDCMGDVLIVEAEPYFG